MMQTIMRRLLAAVMLTLISINVFAQDQLPYQEGPVVQVTAVRTQPGKYNEYVSYLISGQYNKVMAEAKKQGLIVSYAFYSATPRSPKDPDLYIVETYANMAAFDGLADKMTALSNSVWGSMKQADQADASRESLRTIIGSQLIRELQPRQ